MVVLCDTVEVILLVLSPLSLVFVVVVADGDGVVSAVVDFVEGLSDDVAVVVLVLPGDAIGVVSVGVGVVSVGVGEVSLGVVIVPGVGVDVVCLGVVIVSGFGVVAVDGAAVPGGLTETVVGSAVAGVAVGVVTSVPPGLDPAVGGGVTDDISEK